MEVKNKVVVVTGGANGIGRALAARFLQEGAKGLMLGDIDGAKVLQVAEELTCLGQRCDVAQEADVQSLVRQAESQLGRVFERDDLPDRKCWFPVGPHDLDVGVVDGHPGNPHPYRAVSAYRTRAQRGNRPGLRPGGGRDVLGR